MDLSIADGWDSYRTEVMPRDAGREQLQETRRAFYAGAVCVLGMFESIAVESVTFEEGRDCNVYPEVTSACGVQLSAAGRRRPGPGEDHRPRRARSFGDRPAEVLRTAHPYPGKWHAR